MRPALIPIALALALAAGCGTPVQNPVTGETERTVMDEREELQAGREQHKQVLAEYGVVQDESLQAYVRDIGLRLARNSERPHLDWHFTVLDSPEVNAFALPGGYIYVTRGIMAYMDSEADLAGVIGHEIGHVTARHSAQRATRAQTAGIGVLAATVLGAILEGRGVSGAGELASDLSQTVAAGYIARYSREQELQSDRLGAQYLSRTGYDPRNMLDVLQVLRNQERFAADLARAEGRSPRQGNDWLASHPTNEQRIRDMQQIVAQYPARGAADDARSRYLQRVNGLAFGESREQGVTRGRNFFHEPLGFAITAPAGWKIENQAEALALVNGEANAGLILQMVPPKAGNSHEEILRNLVQSGSTDRYSIRGMPATHFIGTRRDSQGRTQQLEGTVVTGPGNRHYLFLYSAADAAALQRARTQLREAESSFRALSASERAAAKPWTLRTVPYPRGGFAELARSSPLPNAEAQLRLLNGFYAGGAPQPGQLVKTVVE
ncbi:MAG: M48 family metalloprotease [Pseudomonadota bacterium]